MPQYLEKELVRDVFINVFKISSLDNISVFGSIALKLYDLGQTEISGNIFNTQPSVRFCSILSVHPKINCIAI